MTHVSRLSYDVIYMITENLLFKNLPRYGELDLRKINAYTLFMYYNVNHMRAIFSILSKMNKLMIFYNNKICLCKDNLGERNDYFVTKKMLSDLFNAGMNCLSSIRISNLPADLPVLDNFSTLENERIIRHLLKIKAPSTSESSLFSSNLNFNISELFINNSSEIIKKHLITLFSINAENIELESFNEDLIFEFFLADRPIFDRTKKIKIRCSIYMDSKNNLFERLKVFLNFFINCCPNIEHMEFNFSCSSSCCPIEFITALETFITSFVDYFKFFDLGNECLKISLDFDTVFDECFLKRVPKDHKLFTLGNSALRIQIKGFYARIIEFNDLIGRQHECSFSISFENLSDESPYGSSDYDSLSDDD